MFEFGRSPELPPGMWCWNNQKPISQRTAGLQINSLNRYALLHCLNIIFFCPLKKRNLKKNPERNVTRLNNYPLIPSHLSTLSHRPIWYSHGRAESGSQGKQYQVVFKSSASGSGPQKQLRQGLSPSSVGQHGDSTWSPRLPRSTEGSVSHHNSSRLQPVGNMPERQILTCWSARRAEREAGEQKGNLKLRVSLQQVTQAASCGSEAWSFYK